VTQNIPQDHDGSDLDEASGLPLWEIRDPPTRAPMPPAAQIIVQDGQPRVALSRQEAATALGMSVDSFEKYVQGQVKTIRCGRMLLYAPTELERWASEAGERTLR